MERAPRASRAQGREPTSQRAAELARAAGFATRVRRLREDGRADRRSARSRSWTTALFLAKLRESPFYPAGGGQVTDAGWIELDGDAGVRAELARGVPLRATTRCSLVRGRGLLREATRVRAVVPWTVRFPTMANHTATHLLHQALRDVLGDHVKQAGSAVRPDKLRFDFTHPQALTSEERERGRAAGQREDLREPAGARRSMTPLEEARRLGAMALFGEKYGEIVRVVEVGATRASSAAARTCARPPRSGVRDPLRGLGRRRRAADRGGHLRRGLRAPARSLARGRRAPRRARGAAQGGEEAAGRREEEIAPAVREENGVSVIVQSVRRARRRRAARPLRPLQAAPRAGRGRARLARGRDGAPRRQLRPVRRRSGSARPTCQGGRRPSSAAAAAGGRRWRAPGARIPSACRRRSPRRSA